MCCMLFCLQLGVFAGGLHHCSPAFVGQTIVEVFRCGCRFIIGDVFAGVAVTFRVLLANEAGNMHALMVVLIFACF